MQLCSRFCQKTVMLLLLLVLGNASAAWQSYPKNLQQYDFSGDKLEKNWGKLAGITFLPFPNMQALQDVLKQYPAIGAELATLGAKSDADPALKAAAAGDYAPYVARIQNLWRMHFEGKFEQTYTEGRDLGSLGVMPAIQSKIMYAHLVLTDPKQKLKAFQEIDKEILKYAKVAKNHPFVIYGQVYARARLLQLLSVLKAEGTGYLDPAIASLKKLSQQYPDRGLYDITLGGLYAGIIEKAGAFLGRTMYGASADEAIGLYNGALKRAPKIPVVYHEYAVALKSIDQKKYKADMVKLLNICIKLPAYSAEEALNKRACGQLLSKMQK